MRSYTVLEMKKQDYSTHWWFNYAWNFLLLGSACSLWIITSLRYPHLDGVSVYQLMPTLPKQNKFIKYEGKTAEFDAFAAKALLLDYCVFPDVFNTLANTNNVKAYLLTRGMGDDPSNRVDAMWNKINFNATRRFDTEYNLPYDGLVQTRQYPAMSSQYYPPVCRCMNDVLSTYASRNAKDKFDDARQALDRCMATQPIIKRQTLIGSVDDDNKDINKRKYISRHAMLFQLCAAFLVGLFYNMIDYNYTDENRTSTRVAWVLLVISIILIWLANLLSVNAVNPTAGITWGSIIIPAGLIMAGLVELMWSYLAKNKDRYRATFMHPLTFYIIISALYTIASVENGVFTLSVLVTQVFQANVLTMSYTGTLFAAHGKIWKNSTSSRTGFFLLILLAGLIHIYHLIPFFPVNIGRSTYLWIIPTLFSVICYSKILFIDHFMEEEDTDKKIGEHKTTHSEHLFDIGYVILLTVVVLHFIISISNLSLGDPTATSTSYNAGKLTKRLNYAFGEMNVLDANDRPFYDTLTNNNQNSFHNSYYINA